MLGFTPHFYNAYNCRKAAVLYLDNLVSQNFYEAAWYVCFRKSDENRKSAPMYYSDIKQKWIEVMESYREENTYIKSYESLSKWPAIINSRAKVEITVVENGIEKTYYTEITFGTVHGRKAIKDIKIDTRFGEALSGIDIDIFNSK